MAASVPVKIKRGTSSTLPTTKADGTIYFTTDTEQLFIDYNNNRAEISKNTEQRVIESNTTKAYISGVTTAGISMEGVCDSGVYLTTTAGEINATQYKLNEKVSMNYDADAQAIGFTFLD